MAKETEISGELQAALKQLVDEFDNDERSVRERQIRQWKKLEYYWAGFTRLWWSDVAHDWRIFDDGYGYETNGQGYYDKPMNVYRAYLESIIAALSSTVPPIKCTPDDADNMSDVITARGASKIAELIYKHNDAPLLWAKALWIYCGAGMVAAYNCTIEDKKFGTYEKEDYKDEEIEQQNKSCPLCGAIIPDEIYDEAVRNQVLEQDEFDPMVGDGPLDQLTDAGLVLCPNCQQQVDPEIKIEKILVSRLVGVTQHPKSRQKIEVYGGLFVKIPNWARCQEEIPYLGYSYETHYTNCYAKYPHLRDSLEIDAKITSTDGNELYERWGRLSPQYYGEYPRATPTVRNWWFRPSAFEAIKDDDIREELQKLFPDGCYAVWVNEVFAEAVNQCLDDHWTLTINPLSNYVHFDPLGMLVTSVQEITQDLISLSLQSIEHGVPQTFADPSVLDFNHYRQSEVLVGGIYPAKPKSGKQLSEAFHVLTTANLSQEAGPFGDKVQQLGQFVSGAMPSIWGGAEAGGSSRTAAQASMSRNQSLQRLGLTWKMIIFWWSRTFGKAIPAYIKDMVEDEKIVREIAKNKFVNEMIRKSEMDGKLGNIECESAENLPMTFGQVRDVLMEMIQLNNPQILAILGDPNNFGVIQEYLGLDKLTVPGESDREKQYEEIQALLMSGPTVEMDPMTMQPQEMPSVMPEMEVDNHQIEGEICRSWAVGESGRQAKIENPDGYKNVLLHMKVHMMMFQQMQMMMNPQPQPQGGEGQDKLRPVEENSNA